MNYKKLFVVMLAITAIAATFATTAAAAKTDTVTEPVPVSHECVFVVPEGGEKISAELVTVRNSLRVDTGEKFHVKVFLKNTGNTPWFSSKSSCAGNKISLGTDMSKDHNSVFYNKDIKEDDNNWESPSRVGMDQEKIIPGEIASFTFWSKAQKNPDIFKEYLTPIVNNTTWLDNAQSSFYVMIGDTVEGKTAERKKMLYAYQSGSVRDINLDGEKKLTVDLSEQKVTVTLDGKTIREFRVSTGAYKTPTPVGEYSIKLKQDVRVGGKAPYYIMPKFMWFRTGGYGFHALPSLRTDGGRFWTEARTHIGVPVSHGCIRLLPEEADFLYEFADLGTKVSVKR